MAHSLPATGNNPQENVTGGQAVTSWSTLINNRCHFLVSCISDVLYLATMWFFPRACTEMLLQANLLQELLPRCSLARMTQEIKVTIYLIKQKPK